MSGTGLVIDVKDLTKSFSGKTAVNRLSMQVRRGEIHGFLGPNGSGKTTFIRMVCGLLRPDSGSGTCMGFDLLTQSDMIRPRIGYMPQRFSLYEDLSVRENLKFIGRIYRVDNLRDRVEGLIVSMGLKRYADQLSGTLSGGWKQRLALTSCLLHEPELLLLDEPTAGVDPTARRDFWDEVYELSGRGVTSLISTHYMDEAERCHRVAYLAYGDLLAAGTADEVVASSGLATWLVDCDSPHGAAADLRILPGVEQVVPFGMTLHVSGTDSVAVERSLAGFSAPGYRYRRSEASLEDAFIGLMQRHINGRADL